MSHTALEIGIAILLIYLCRKLLFTKAVTNLPPGPRAIPFFGNIFDLPPNDMPTHQHWLKLKDKYGALSSVTVMGQTVIFIHDLQAAHDLLEKGSLKTSDRPSMKFLRNFCGCETFMPMMQYDDRFRHFRKLVHQQLGSKTTAAKFNEIQEMNTWWLLGQLLSRPDRVKAHLKSAAGATILRMTYGYITCKTSIDPLVGLSESLIGKISAMASPLSTLVDILPVIQYIPGLQLREHGKQLKQELQVATNGPYEFAKQQLDNGDDRQSYVSKLIKCCRASAQSIEIPIEDELGIKWTAVVMYLAGVETTATALHSFILAMVLFPGVQEKAQEEIDRVIGFSRFPDLTDRENLPYIDSLVKEIHRWSPVTPLGLPHAASQNISYNNFTIPQGSILLPAVWWFLHDPQRYQNPDVFEPERFLYPRNEPDSTAIAFGFGRRICPGRHFADTSIFINVARILSALEIKKAVNPQGVEVDPILQLQPGVLPGLRDFPVHIKPRSASKRDTIELMQLRLPAETNNATFLNRMYC